jgi:GDP-4-dehydro-6-deoxy-D-mannose reductase
MKPRVLITGADGFVGRRLAAFLADEVGASVLGIDMAPARREGPWDRCDFEICNILERESVFSNVKRFRPDYVFHLAAQSSVGLSWKDPELTYRIALSGQSNLLDALRENAPEAVVHIACSAEEYGRVRDEDIPIREDQPLRPASPYALSKVMQEYHSVFCHHAYGTKVIVTRAFNMTGPGQSPVFVVSDFAKQIAEAEAGLREPVIKVGNLEARRDFSDVRDLVEVYWSLLQKGVPGEVYNVCSGRDHSIREILDILLCLSKADIKVETDPSRMREVDIPVLRGDNGKLKKLLDWVPGISMEKTLQDVLDWWRMEVYGREGSVSGCKQ